MYMCSIAVSRGSVFADVQFFPPASEFFAGRRPHLSPHTYIYRPAEARASGRACRLPGSLARSSVLRSLIVLLRSLIVLLRSLIVLLRSLIEPRRCVLPAAMAKASATMRPVSATQGEPALSLLFPPNSACMLSSCRSQPACLTHTRHTPAGSPAPTARCASAQAAALVMESATQAAVAARPASLLAAVTRGGAGPTARLRSQLPMAITPPPHPLPQWLRGRQKRSTSGMRHSPACCSSEMPSPSLMCSSCCSSRPPCP